MTKPRDEPSFAQLRKVEAVELASSSLQIAIRSACAGAKEMPQLMAWLDNLTHEASAIALNEKKGMHP
jgi:hypothetical protein